MNLASFRSMFTACLHRPLFSLYLLALVGCEPRTAAKLRVYGGAPVATGALPAVVAITLTNPQNDPPTLICSGTLIAPEVVLTAGHCLADPSLNPRELEAAAPFYRVYLGDGADGSVLPAQYEVTAALQHPLFRAHPLGHADYGILLLSEPVPDVEPIALVASLTDLTKAEDGASFSLVGFGMRRDGGVGRKEEVQVHGGSFTSTEATVGGGGLDACDGDSGGPLLTTTTDGTPRLFGSVSRGVHLSCGEGTIVSLASDAFCWIGALPHVHLPGWDSLYQGCDPVDRRYTDVELTASRWDKLCSSGTATAAQRETLAAVTQRLAAPSCEAAWTDLSTRSELNLDYLMLRDLSPLSSLPQLRRLSLKGNRLTTVTSLRHLSALRELVLDGNNIRDVSPLAGLFLRGLVVYGAARQLWNYTDTPFLRLCRAVQYAASQLKESALIDALLWKTEADDCRTANERLLSLTHLDVSNRQITDLSPLSGLTTLRSLDLSHNPCSDLTPLASLEHLQQLDLTGTHVTSLAPLAPLLARGLKVQGVAPLSPQ